ncbi:MAG: aminotransferase class V-fold PLP-dependent enzyme [Paenibacillaceae bacterium]
MEIRYFDHAASSWPKPPAVLDAMKQCVEEYGANPGRGSHKMAVRASRALFEARNNLSRLFNIHNPNDISFALNTSMALNQAIKGFLKPGDHVISTSIEHNSVRRPLEFLKHKIGIEITYIKMSEQGRIDPVQVRDATNSQTKLIVCTHGSNLLGSILPIADIAEIAYEHGVRLLVDAAQTAGTLEVDIQALGIDMLAFPGHKGLLGPQGTGGLYIHPDLELEPLIHGGTGSKSEDTDMPNVRPDRYEGGTPNTVGIAGLNEGVKFVLNETVHKIHNKEWELTQHLMSGLLSIPNIHILGPSLNEDRTGIVAFALPHIDASEMSFILDQSFNIAVRAGYHCTPLAHETAGTLAAGAVRASVGYSTTMEEVEYLIASVKEIVRHYDKG